MDAFARQFNYFFAPDQLLHLRYTGRRNGIDRWHTGPPTHQIDRVDHRRVELVLFDFRFGVGQQHFGVAHVNKACFSRKHILRIVERIFAPEQTQSVFHRPERVGQVDVGPVAPGVGRKVVETRIGIVDIEYRPAPGVTGGSRNGVAIHRHGVFQPGVAVAVGPRRIVQRRLVDAFPVDRFKAVGQGLQRKAARLTRQTP